MIFDERIKVYSLFIKYIQKHVTIINFFRQYISIYSFLKTPSLLIRPTASSFWFTSLFIFFDSSPHGDVANWYIPVPTDSANVAKTKDG